MKAYRVVRHYLDNRLRDGGKVVSLMRRPRFTPQENYLINSWYSFLLEADPQSINLVKYSLDN
jgi:hypothetical protein